MCWSRLVLALMISVPASAAVEKSFEEKALETGDAISKSIEKTAERIDITLAGKKYTRKANPSSAEVRQLLTWSEGGRWRPATDFGLNLRLPNVERRWQLRFSSYDEEVESRDLSQKRVRTRPRERNYGAGIFFFERLGRVRTAFLPRLQLKSPLEVSYLLRFETTADIGALKIFPRVDLFADAAKGTGEFASLEFRYDVNKRFEISLQNTEEYHSRDNAFSTQHGLSFDYALAENQAQGLSFVFASNNRPSFHAESFTVSIPYSRRLYPDRLTVTAAPYLNFAKNVRFKGEAGLSLAADLVF